MEFLRDGLSLAVIGSSLGSWLTWLAAQLYHDIRRLLLLALAFNMMGQRAQNTSPSRRTAWIESGAMPWDDDALHKDFPFSWKWVEESEALWSISFDGIRVIPITIRHELQDTVIVPQGSWDFSGRVFDRDPSFPLELVCKPGDHRFSGPKHLDTFLRLAAV